MDIKKLRDIYEGWFYKNKNRFIHVPYVWKTDKESFHLRFDGIISEISLRISNYSTIELRIFDPMDEHRDTILDLYDWFEHTDETGNTCEAKRSSSLPADKLWDHVLEYMLQWVNREFAPDRYLYIHAVKKDLPFASCISDAAGIKRFRNNTLSYYGKYGAKIDSGDYFLFMSVVKDRYVHSEKLLELRKEKDIEKRRLLIRSITHSKPLLVFWVNPDGEVIDAGDEHHDNPPNGDRSVLSDPKHTGFLRGRSAFIADVIYIVIYGDNKDRTLTNSQLVLLKKAKWNLINEVHMKIQQEDFDSLANIKFIDEPGNDIHT